MLNFLRSLKRLKNLILEKLDRTEILAISSQASLSQLQGQFERIRADMAQFQEQFERIRADIAHLPLTLDKSRQADLQTLTQRLDHQQEQIQLAVKSVEGLYPHLNSQHADALNLLTALYDHTNSQTQQTQNLIEGLRVTLEHHLRRYQGSLLYDQKLWPWNYRPATTFTLPSGRLLPRISVVITAFNQGHYLEETVRSLLLQGYPNLECILVDGGSTDATVEVIRAYLHRFKACLSESFTTRAEALNRGFKLATGDILAGLDAGDIHLPETLWEVALAFDHYPIDVVVGGTGWRGQPDGEFVLVQEPDLPVERPVPLPLARLCDLEEQKYQGRFFYPAAVFWTRQAWRATGAGFDETLTDAADYDFWLRLARAEHQVYRVNARLIGARLGQPAPISPTEQMQVIERYRQSNQTQPEGPALAIYTTPIGTYCLPAEAREDVIAFHMRQGLVFEPEVVEAARQIIQPGSVVLDVGACFGQMSLIFSQLVGETGSVFAFEAEEFVFSLLQQNLDLNQAHNVRAIWGATYNQTGLDLAYPVPDFQEFSAYGSYGLDPRAQAGRRVKCLAIDDLQIRRPVSFMKVDVQGSDLFTLQGARQTIEAHQMPVLFEYEEQFQARFNTSFQDYLDFIQSISYEVVKTIYNINYLIAPRGKKLFFPGMGSQGTADPAPPLNTGIIGSLPSPPYLCKFLQSRAQVETCTEFLYRNGYASHSLKCKDWDLAHLVSQIGDGNFLDMGSSDSYILKNLLRKGVKGAKYGIDLRDPDQPLRGVEYLIGDLLQTPLADGFCTNITCLSVLEHGVDYQAFAREAARLLHPGGRLFVTFDYWEPLVVPTIDLYGRPWQPLDRQRLLTLVTACTSVGLNLVQDIDWETQEAVIGPDYYSPDPSLSYTFGLVVFVQG